MQIELTLSPNKFMWFLPNSTIQLTEENPGPVSVDFEILPRDQQYSIIVAIQKNNLTLGGAELNKLIEIYNRTSIPTIQTVVQTTVKDISPEEMVKQSPVQIKKELANCVDLNKLRSVLELEKTGKNRKTVTSFLITKIGKIKETMIVDVESSIARLTNPHAKEIVTDPLDNLSNTMEVIEDEIETITIEFPDETKTS